MTLRHNYIIGVIIAWINKSLTFVKLIRILKDKFKAETDKNQVHKIRRITRTRSYAQFLRRISYCRLSCWLPLVHWDTFL